MPEEKTAVSGSSSDAAQGSAPGNSQKATGQTVDSAPQKANQEPVKMVPPKGILREVANLREDRRNLRSETGDFKAQIDASNRRIAELEESLNQTKKDVQDSLVSTGDDISKPSVSSFNDVRSVVREELNAFASQQKLFSEVNEAEKWLLSQSHFQKDPNGLNEVGALIKGDQRLLRVFDADPQLAVEEANRRWLASKGISNGAGAGQSATSSSRASGVSPSASSSGGSKQQWTREEIRAHIRGAAEGTPERKKRIMEMEKVVREGRIITK